MGNDRIDVCVLGKHDCLSDEIAGDLDSEQPSAGTQANEFVFLIYLNLELADQFLRTPSDHAIVNVDSQDDNLPICPLLDEGTVVSFCALEPQLQEYFQQSIIPILCALLQAIQHFEFEYPTVGAPLSISLWLLYEDSFVILQD